MLKTVRIFISSTFKDMDAERDVLIKNVFPRLRETAESIGLFIREVDLRWGVTEDQAKRGAALELSLDGIDECKPYFLCMLGKRYGWIPAQPSIQSKKMTASYHAEKSGGSRLGRLEPIPTRIGRTTSVDAMKQTMSGTCVFPAKEGPSPGTGVDPASWTG